jgi:hypothetical protein
VTPAGALCSVHADAAARTTCGRCGRFACDACLAPGEPPWCVQCDGDRYGEWTRGPYSIGIVLQQGLQLFARNAPVALALAVLASSAEALITASDLVALPVLQLVQELVVNGFCTAAFLLCVHDTAAGRSPVAVEVIGNAVGALPRVVFATIGYWVLVLLGAAALVVPGFYLLGLLAVCQVIAVLEPGKGALSGSYALLRGRLGAPLVVQFVVVSAITGTSIASLVLTRFVFSRGFPAVAISFAGNVSRSLFASVADAMLFCIWLRLRRLGQHSVA